MILVSVVSSENVLVGINEAAMNIKVRFVPNIFLRFLWARTVLIYEVPRLIALGKRRSVGLAKPDLALRDRFIKLVNILGRKTHQKFNLLAG